MAGDERELKEGGGPPRGGTHRGRDAMLRLARIAADAAVAAGTGGTSKLATLALRRLWPALAVIVVFISVGGFFMLSSIIGGNAGGGASSAVSCAAASAGSSRTPPARLIPIYQQAAAAYRLGASGWAYLAAINRVETDFGHDLSVSSAGAVGWMQILPSTWAMYGQGDPMNPRDAIFAAARILVAGGAPGSWSKAIFSYNHANWYVQEVTNYAYAYLGACSAAPVTLVSASGMVNPLAQAPGVVPERVDQGVDYADPHPGYILAMANGTVTYAGPDAGWFGNAVNYTITDPGWQGPRYVYVAEGITPLLHVPAGATEPVAAGQPIAQFIPGSSTGIETGFAAEPGLFGAEAMSLRQAAMTGDPGQHRTACGQLMSDLISSLGGPPGLPEGKAVIGTGEQALPPGQAVTAANCPPVGGGSTA